MGSKFIPFGVDHFSEGALYSGKQTGREVIKIVSLVEMAEEYQISPLKGSSCQLTNPL